MCLGDTDRTALLRRARGALEERLCGVHFEERPQTALLRAPGAAFVSLYSPDGALRGCRGRLTADDPLGEAVEEIAISTALHDPRFARVTANELPNIRIVVQVLTPRRRVADSTDIELGRHGIVLTKGRRSAVFLPNVATEIGWDLPTTLTHLARKAGLPGEAWRDGATFDVFETDTVSE